MKPIKAKCQYCDKELISLYPQQLKWNLESHESACKKNPKNLVLRKKIDTAMKRVNKGEYYTEEDFIKSSLLSKKEIEDATNKKERK